MKSYIYKGVCLLIWISSSLGAVASAQGTLYGDLFKDSRKHTKATGFMTVHRYEDKLYLEIPNELFGRDFVLSSQVVRCSELSLTGSSAAPPVYLTIDRTDSLVIFRGIMNEVVYDKEDPNQRKAFALSAERAIYKAFPIKGRSDKAILFEATTFFDPSNRDVLNLTGRTFDSWLKVDDIQVNRSASMLDGFDVYDRALLFRHTAVTSFALAAMGLRLVDRVDVTAELSTYFILLPEVRMRPRPAHPEIGSKTVRFLDFRTINNVRPREYVTRMNLPAGTSMIYYVDTLFTPLWRSAIDDALEAWNDGFERIGMGRPLQSKPYSRDRSFRADDPMINTIAFRKNYSRGISTQNIIDPRTGEIMSAHITLSSDLVDIVRQQGMCQMSAIDERYRTYDISEEVIADGVRAFTIQEIGRSLGLDYNFAGSAAYSPEEITSPDFTKANGFLGSAMDNVIYNTLAAPGDRERGVVLVLDRIGKADELAIEYMYRPLGSDEESTLMALATKHIGDPRYAFRQLSEPRISDPRGQASDLGNDPLRALEIRTPKLKYILANASRWYGYDNVPLVFKQNIAGMLFSDYFYGTIAPMFGYIGGLYIHGDYVPDGTPRLVGVPRELQRSVTKAVLKACEDLSWFDTNPELLSWAGIGSSLSDWIYSSGMPVTSLMFRVPFMDLSIRNSARPYTEQEYVDEIEQFIFGEVKRGGLLSDTKLLLAGSYITALIATSPSLKKIYETSKPDAPKSVTDIVSLMDSIGMKPTTIALRDAADMETSARSPLSIPYYQMKDMSGLHFLMLERCKALLLRAKHRSADTIYRERIDYHIRLIDRVVKP